MPVKPLKSKRSHEKNDKQGYAIILARAIFDRDKIRKNKRGEISVLARIKQPEAKKTKRVFLSC
jgi:hypothetical protein